MSENTTTSQSNVNKVTETVRFEDAAKVLITHTIHQVESEAMRPNVTKASLGIAGVVALGFCNVPATSVKQRDIVTCAKVILDAFKNNPWSLAYSAQYILFVAKHMADSDKLVALMDKDYKTGPGKEFDESASKWADEFVKNTGGAIPTTLPAEEPATADQPKKTRKKKEQAAQPNGIGEIAQIEPVAPVAVPEIKQDPSDPFSGIAAGVASKIAPTINAIATNIISEVIKDRIAPVTSSLETAIRNVAFTARASQPSSGTVDEVKVRDLIKTTAIEESGKTIIDALQSGGAGALVKVLDKAADAVSSVIATPSAPAIKLEIPSSDPDYIWDPNLEKICEVIHKASSVSPQKAMLVGPTGAGKTDLAQQFAAKFGMPFVKFDCANNREPRDWFGVKGASSGSTYFRKSKFWTAVETGGCVILLDEFNRAPDHVRNPLMPLFDHTMRSYVEDVAEVLQVGPGTVFFATLNEGFEYSGTFTTDRAMASRFTRRIEVPYLSEAKEIDVITRKTGMSPSDAGRLVQAATAVRAKAMAVSGGGLSSPISTRQLIAAAQDMQVGGAFTLAYNIFNHYSAEGGENSERAQVIKTFELKGFKL